MKKNRKTFFLEIFPKTIFRKNLKKNIFCFCLISNEKSQMRGEIIDRFGERAIFGSLGVEKNLLLLI